MIRFGSLFSGIGGIDLGLERAGMECRWQVEIDPWCRRVLAKHWPDVKRYEDVRDVGADNLEAVDLIAGGFPCQDVSVAGKGAGISGSRSGLWSEFYRIVCELRPRFVLVENVPALLSRGLDTVLADLAEAGFDAEWEVLSACAFGAPHTRERLFLLAYPQGFQGRAGLCGGGEAGQERASRRILADRSNCLDVWQVEEITGRIGLCLGCDEDWCNWHDCHREDCGCPDPWDESEDDPQFGWWATEPRVGRVAYGVHHRLDRLGGIGNAVVPQIAYYLGQQIVEAATCERA